MFKTKAAAIFIVVILLFSTSVSAIRISTVMPYNDTFDGNTAENWDAITSNGGIYETITDGDNKYLKLSGTKLGSVPEAYIERFLTGVSRSFVVSFRVSSNMMGQWQGFGAVVAANGVNLTVMNMTEGQIFSNNVSVTTFVQDEWYTITAYVDADQPNYTLVIKTPTGSELKNSLPLPANYAKPAEGFGGELRVRVSHRHNAGEGTELHGCIDDFKLTHLPQNASISSQTFEERDASGAFVSDITNGSLSAGKVAGVIKATNETGDDKSVTLILALMDGEDEIIDLKCTKRLVPHGASDMPIETIIDITEVKPTYKLYTFVLKGINTLDPLADEKILPASRN